MTIGRAKTPCACERQPSATPPTGPTYSAPSPAAFPRSTAFVVELPTVVSGALVRRSAEAVLRLAAELGSPELGPAQTL